MRHALERVLLLVLFAVAALGLLAGRVKVAGFSLGVTAVLFAGLLVGALAPALQLPEILSTFGLVLFVYTVGLSSGPGFFSSFRRRGLRDNAFAVGVLTLGAALSALFARLLHHPPAFGAGLFAGASTNIPALASVVERLEATATSGAEALHTEAVVACSVAYPGGVLGVLAAVYVAQRLLRIDYDKEPLSAHLRTATARRLESVTVRITRPQTSGEPVGEIRRRHGFHVMFGRRKRGAAVSVVSDEDVLAEGDSVTVIGPEGDLPTAVAYLGEISGEQLALDRSIVDYRRMFVSNPAVTERPLASIALPQRFGGVITRVRRGDVELLADRDTELELGDRVRVVAPRARMDEISAFLGDSYKALSEIDVVTFGLGIALGLLLGQLPLGIPGGPTFKLGSAGGPLLVGLLLGRLGRTGPLVWTLPYSANLTLRQLGLVLFLAGVGTRSGNVFVATIAGGGGLGPFAAGLAVTLAISVAALYVGHRWLKIPMGVLVGMVAGIQTQPAVLAFGVEQTRNDLPNTGYAAVFPVSTIAKIILAQVLVSV